MNTMDTEIVAFINPLAVFFFFMQKKSDKLWHTPNICTIICDFSCHYPTNVLHFKPENCSPGLNKLGAAAKVFKRCAYG